MFYFLGHGTVFVISLDFCVLTIVLASVTLCFGQVISVFLKCAKVLGFSKNNTKVVFASYDCYNDYSPARVVLYMVQL